MTATDRTRALIASRHGKFVAAKVATVAEKYLKAYNNLGNIDMTCNGEMAAVRRVLEHVPGDIIDAGANEGQWAGAVCRFASGRTIHSFEPVPHIFAKLCAKLAGVPGVQLVNAGLGALTGTITINYNPAVSGISSAFPVIDWQGDAQPVECRIMSGDDYLEEQRIGRVGLLKIDVEGMEAACLAGFEQAFAKGIIATVQFEHGPSHVHSGHTLKYFMDWLEARDFALFRIFPHRLLPLHYDIRRESFEMQNVFAIRRDVRARLGL